MLQSPTMYIDRLETYSALEDALGGRVLTYITSDRPAFEISIDWEAIGPSETLALFLYTRGGDTSAAWNIISLLRLYCQKLIVVVPHRAHSAGTIIAIGADEILMTRQATLGPIDPHETNPLVPKGDDGTPMAVSVEAVNGYIELAHSELGVKDGGLILSELTERIHPLVLGQAYRSRMQARQLARKLLRYQIKEPGTIERASAFLAGGCGSHDYTINRREAKEDLGLSVRYPEESLDRLIKALYNDLMSELMGAPMKLTERDDVRSMKSGFLESLPGGSSYYSYDYLVVPKDGANPAQTKLMEKGWHNLPSL